MAGVYRVGRALRVALVSVLAFALPSVSFAFACTEYQVTVAGGSNSGWLSSASAACTWYVNFNNVGKPGIYQIHLGWTTASQCQILNASNDQLSIMTPDQREGTCGCTFPLVEKNGSCVSPCADKQGVAKDLNFGLGGAQGVPPSGMGPKTACMEGSPAPGGYGCMMTGSVQGATWLTSQGGNYSYGGLPGGQWAGWARMTYTGNHCTPDYTKDGSTDAAGVPADNATASTAKNNNCKPGEFAGTVNGVQVCAPPADKNSVASADKSGGTVTSTNPDGSTTTTSTDKAVSESCINGVCTKTTTTTVTTSTGSGTPTVSSSTSSGTATQASYCSENPTSKLCKDEGDGSFSGSCDTDFKCEGDAAMCATARATNLMQCSVGTDKTANEVTAYKSARDSGTATGIQTDNVTISSGSFDQTNVLSQSASCMADKVVTVSGKSITIPFSGVCGHLQMLGNIMLALSFLVALVIVGKPS